MLVVIGGGVVVVVVMVGGSLFVFGDDIKNLYEVMERMGRVVVVLVFCINDYYIIFSWWDKVEKLEEKEILFKVCY